MSANTIDAKLLSKMFLSGAMTLESQKDIINELNVFPVPDGDTGTNMTLTIMSAAKDVYELGETDMKTLCKSISSGSLRGARGNSGVILSQLLRGFTKVVRDYDEIDVAIISAAFDKAVETAYKAVMKPKEGTILTVAKGACDKANELFEQGVEDLDEFMAGVIAEADAVLQKTPDMLPVLKEAGVVDSGGQGLLEVLKGAYNAFKGNGLEFSMDTQTEKVAGETRKLNSDSEVIEEEIKYAYDTKFQIFTGEKVFNIKHENDYKDYLDGIGENGQVSVEGDFVNVSVVTNDPGLVLQKSLKIGQLTNVSIVNLKLKDIKNAPAANEAKTAEKKPYGFISVSAGDGIGEIFRNLGVDCLIEGGQTMNPSTEDILNAINGLNAETIYVLPNNKNIIMAANQARDLTEDKTVVVIPTKTVPQGISSLISFSPEATVEDNTAAMTEQISLVKTGQVTYAVRDTVIEGTEIHQDDFMGIGDSGILSNGKVIEDVIVEMLEKIVDDSTELISIYYGSDVAEADAEKIKALVESKFSSCDIEFQMGGQPVYYYIMSAE